MSLRSQFANLVYPQSCIHCNVLMERPSHFCAHCLELFTLIREEGRCAKCGSEIPHIQGTCKPCRKRAHPFRRLSSCFDAIGPAPSLLETYIKRGHFSLAKEIAALMVLQLEAHHFPPFDVITTVPHFFCAAATRVGEEVGKLLGVPYKSTLKRVLAPNPRFHLKKRCNIINQTVLLLDTSMNTRETIRSAAWTLDRGGVETLFGMTFCAT